MSAKSRTIYVDTGVDAPVDVVTDVDGNSIVALNNTHYSLTTVVTNPSTFTGTVQPIVSNDGGTTWQLIGSETALTVATSVIHEGYLRGALFGVRIGVTGGSADIALHLTLK
jgi:hypothetical protein